MATAEQGLSRLPETHHRGRNLIAGLAGLGIVAAGAGYIAMNSGNEPQPTQNPGGIVEPSSSPVPTPFTTESPVVVIPSESPVATPTQTPEVTPTPTPEATLMPITSIIEGAHPKVSKTTIASDIKATLTVDPQTIDTAWTKQAVQSNWTKCQNGDPSTTGDQTNNKFDACENLTFYDYEKYIKTGDPKDLQRAKNMYNYTYNTFPGAEYRNHLNDTLKQDFK